MRYRIPTYVRFKDGKGRELWGLSEMATVATWRKIWHAAIEREDKHTLRSFRAATLILQTAEDQGLAEDAVPLAVPRTGPDLRVVK